MPISLKKLFPSKKYSLFNKSYKQFQSLAKSKTIRFDLSNENLQPCLYDNTGQTNFDRHYIYHPAWAVRIIKKIDPKVHVDISSTLHFCSMLSAFTPVEFYDYRPAVLELDSLVCKSADLTNLHFESNSIESLSCMHTVEHVGLGRYGDPLDYDGDLKAFKELARVVKPGGNLLIVVPTGAEAKICFNAHRIYTPDQIIAAFSNFELKDFSLIPENEEDGGLVQFPNAELIAKQNYGCGCFWFQKK
ncbi:DUF268 domain-containing protein [Solitalea longa]|uniref:DUF268 domain-containing protein n=1 Tax=Solitalea longa TaxID=2079460 RepID=UPI001A9C8A28|nr:DUF268 domain-containing protein [Solitalea longa]